MVKWDLFGTVHLGEPGVGRPGDRGKSGCVFAVLLGQSRINGAGGAGAIFREQPIFVGISGQQPGLVGPKFVGQSFIFRAIDRGLQGGPGAGLRGGEELFGGQQRLG